jgi:hypothetical protein
MYNVSFYFSTWQIILAGGSIRKVSWCVIHVIHHHPDNNPLQQKYGTNIRLSGMHAILPFLSKDMGIDKPKKGVFG